MNKETLDMKNEEIIHMVLNVLKKQIPIKWKLNTLDINNKDADGILALEVKNMNLNFDIEIKKELKNHQLFNIINQKKNRDNFLIIAEKLYPKVRQELKENNINYIEANGNVYINRDGIYLYIDTNKTLHTIKDKGNRAFTKTGLKVIFHFLLEPQLINYTQREIAEITNVALGNIPQILNGLLETKLLLKLNKKEYIINNYDNLLHKWITEYQQTLKPTLLKQRFKLLDRNQNWKDIKFNFQETVWGGEPAGDIITNFLRPERLTLYTKETTKDLMKNYKIIPDHTGDIWAYEMFWKETFNEKTAPLQLVYADLIIEDDKRCKETANIILNEYIKPNI